MNELEFLQKLKKFHTDRIDSFKAEIAKSEQVLEVLEQITETVKRQNQKKLPN